VPTDPLPASSLRWRCDADSLRFETTSDVEPIVGVVGQDSAVESLRFGLEIDAPGQNVFIRGLSGTGRMTLVSRLLAELQPTCDTKHDRCYVHNFSEPDRPRLITLPRGRARAFRRRIHEFAEFIRDGLGPALNAEVVRERRAALEKRQKRQLEEITAPFEKELEEAGLALVPLQAGRATATAIYPVIDGETVTPEQFEQMLSDGKVSEEQREEINRRVDEFRGKFQALAERLRAVQVDHARAVHAVIEGTARALLADHAHQILQEFPGEDVQTFLSEVIDDIGENRLGEQSEGFDPMEVYGVNVLLEQEDDEGCPIVVENTPNLPNLLGSIDRVWLPQGMSQSDYRMIRPGAILHADGGYLILDAREVLSEPGAWRVLIRTLRTGRLEITPPELSAPWAPPSLKPEPIPIQVKVLLLGDSYLYYLLDAHDPDFSQLFKVLADFDSEIPREPDGPQRYAGVIARIVRDEKLPAFHRDAVAELAEHGARVAARGGKLTARFSRVADIAREAAFLARNGAGSFGKRNPAGEVVVRADHVRDAVARGKARADLPTRRFREYLEKGTIRIETDGRVIGQINGLAVISAGPLTYGFPARITASIGAGSAGIIDIEAKAQLGGQIHTKGFNILGGLLRHLLRTDHPLAFSASVTFEQSYGGIDGDSASGAEICCLLSELTEIPIRQGLAITGAIDQHGHLQAIGGVNEKIEGFFDVCGLRGLTGDQGVIIPRANAADLMLRHDVVEACEQGRFAIYAVDDIKEALELLTGVPAGDPGKDGEYPEGTLLHMAMQKAHEFWKKAMARPPRPADADE